MLSCATYAALQGMNNGERDATIQWKQEISLCREIGPEVDLGLICSNNYNNKSTNVSSSSESEENDTLRGLVLCVQAEDYRFPGEQTTQNAMVIGRPRGSGMGGKSPELEDASWIFYWLCDHGRITRAQWALFSSSTQDLIKINFMRCTGILLGCEEKLLERLFAFISIIFSFYISILHMFLMHIVIQ